MNTNSRGSSEITAEMRNSEIASQVSNKLDEIKSILNSQIREAIELAISEQVLLSLQNTIGKQGRGLENSMDLTSSGRHRSPEVRRAWGNPQKAQRNIEVSNYNEREASLDSHISDNYFDTRLPESVESAKYVCISRIRFQVRLKFEIFRSDCY